MTETNLYAYGVVEDEDLAFALDDNGVEGAARVSTVEYRTLSAVVSEIDEMDPDPTDENTRAHDDVLQAVLTHGDGRTVVPMQFGMVFKSERALKGVLRGARPALTRSLRELDGTFEFGVKLVAEDGVDLDREVVRDDAADRFAAVSRREATNDLFSDRLVFNRSYLVDRERREAFDAAVDDVEEAYADELLVRYTGPWAPYSFVDVEIGAKR